MPRVLLPCTQKQALKDQTTVWTCHPSSEFKPSSVTSLPEPDFLSLRQVLSKTPFLHVALRSWLILSTVAETAPHPLPGTGSS